MGIYIGGGQMVAAPRTGDVVKVSAMSGRSDYVGAVRP
jgi:cell wall-associated NlpC family hydrolase